ncbi:MAG: hypothetical protein U0610_24925 [bacterium]
MKSRATQRTQVYLPPELHQRARVLGLRTRRSLTSLVRVALERYVEEAEASARSAPAPDPIDSLIGFVSAGGHARVTHDDEIHGEP